MSGVVPFGGRAARGLRASVEVSLSVAPPGGGNISVPVHLAGSPTSGLRDYSWYTVAGLVVAHKTLLHI